MGSSAYSAKGSPRESYTLLWVFRQCTEIHVHSAEQLLTSCQCSHTVEEVGRVIYVLPTSWAGWLDDQTVGVFGDPVKVRTQVPVVARA